MYTHQRLRNRWLVAYTLIRNPSIQSLTAANLLRCKDKKNENEELIIPSNEASIQVINDQRNVRVDCEYVQFN